MRTAATYFDGQTAAAQKGILEFHANRLRLQLDSGVLFFDRDNARMVPPVGEGVWLIEVNDGASVHFEDQDFGHTVLPEFGLASVATRFERSWRWAIIALVAAIVSTWILLTVAHAE